MPARKKNRKPEPKKQRTEPTRSDRYVAFYSNHAQSRVSGVDMRLTFSEILFADEERLVIEERAAITMTPEQGKALKELLERNIEAYEKKVGKIRWPPKS